MDSSIPIVWSLIRFYGNRASDVERAEEFEFELNVFHTISIIEQANFSLLTIVHKTRESTRVPKALIDELTSRCGYDRLHVGYIINCTLATSRMDI